MIRSADEFVRLRVSDDQSDYQRAAQESASPETWLEVIQRFPMMKVWVVHNKSIQLEILEILARDPEDGVREAVATKNKLSPELFQALSVDPAASVRMRVAYNKNVPRDVLVQLQQDTAVEIAEVASRRLQNL